MTIACKKTGTGLPFSARYKRLELQISGLDALTVLISLSVSESTQMCCVKWEQFGLMIPLCTRKADGERETHAVPGSTTIPTAPAPFSQARLSKACQTLLKEA